MAKIQHGNKGFQVTFDNGYTASIQYGKCNYCDRKDYSIGSLNEPLPNDITCSNFEMAVWDKDNNWVRLTEHDDVAGYVPFEHLPVILALVQFARFDELCKFLAGDTSQSLSLKLS